MKPIGLISTGVLFLVLGAAVPAYAQQEQQDAKPPKQEQQAKPAKQQQAKPEKQQQEAKPAKQEQQQPTKAQQGQQRQQQAKAQQTQQGQQQKQQQPAKSTRQDQQEQAKTQQAQTKSNNQEQQQAKGQQGQQHAQRTPDEDRRQHSQPSLRLSARGEGRVPDDRFRSSFGREHTFRISSPQMVDGYSRFQYGGYWFGFVEPWQDGWYYTDDVYVDYIDGGYYLYNPDYPGTRVSISVVL
jgi:hypothetical protein